MMVVGAWFSADHFKAIENKTKPYRCHIFNHRTGLQSPRWGEGPAGKFVEADWQDFETVLVEDGSTERCEPAVREFESQVDVKYFYKENERPQHCP